MHFNYGISSKLYNIAPGYLNPKTDVTSIIPIKIEDEKALESALYISDNYTLSDKILISLGIAIFYLFMHLENQRKEFTKRMLLLTTKP